MPVSRNDLTMKFLESLPTGVSNVVRDAGGLLAGWTENGWWMALYRDTNGMPTQLVASSNSGRMVQNFTFDSAGRFVSASGDIIPTRMIAEIERPSDQGTLVQISSNVVITPANAAKYNGKRLIWTGAYTLTLSAGLLQFSCVCRPPNSGNATIASDGVVLLDGATTSQTRALASNKLFGIDFIGADSYTVLGS